MHKNFGEWYRLVSIEPKGENLTKRWAGVKEWVNTLRGDDDAVLETVRIFQGLPGKTSRDAFLEAFRTRDPAFPQRNELELRVLAGASLVECMYPDHDDAAHVHTAIITGAAIGASRLRVTDSQFDEVIEEAMAGLQTIARGHRKRSGFSTEILDTKSAETITTAIHQLTTVGPDANLLKTQVAPMAQALVDALRRSEKALKSAAHDLRCADEETNILWWLEGGCSQDLGKPWGSLPKEAVPLLAAKELADLTNTALGPPDAAALLHRIVTNAECEETTIQEYVNAVPSDWVEAFATTTSERALDLAPLSLALSHRGKSNSSSWPQFFEANSKMGSTASMAPSRAAHQMYLETVLLHTLADAEG